MRSSGFFKRNVLVSEGSGSWEISPWQPEYLNDDKFLGKEYKNEWSRYLTVKNQEQILNSTIVKKRTLRFSFFTKAIVKKVFKFCYILKQPPEVRYLALDIIDRHCVVNRFMVSEFLNVAQAVIEKGNFTQKMWGTVIKRMANRSFLRVLSSILLASKYCCNFRAVSAAEIEKTFASSGRLFVFTTNDLIKSELRVFKTINFRIPRVSPLTFVEMFFESFRNEEMKEHLHLTLPSFLNICIDVLDITLIFHREIFQTFYSRITGKPYLTLKDARFLSIEANYMYLAASVIYTAALLQDPSQVVPQELLKFLSSTTRYKRKEIETLGKIILEIIINS